MKLPDRDRRTESSKLTETRFMLRTILAVGALSLLGIVLLRFAFGIFAGLVGLALWLLVLTIKIALVGLVVYFIIRVVSPDTARRLQERWGRPGA